MDNTFSLILAVLVGAFAILLAKRYSLSKLFHSKHKKDVAGQFGSRGFESSHGNFGKGGAW